MYSLKLGTGTAVVLTDRRLIKQLIDKKSNIYSNRPPSFVSHDLITGGDHLLVMQYGNLWRSFRKLIHQYFMESMVEREHIVLQNAEAVQMIHDYMLYPEEHMRHPKRYSNSIIMSLCESFLPQYVKACCVLSFVACSSSSANRHFVANLSGTPSE
jgi:cytochrome P450 family 619